MVTGFTVVDEIVEYNVVTIELVDEVCAFPVVCVMGDDEVCGQLVCELTVV